MASEPKAIRDEALATRERIRDHYRDDLDSTHNFLLIAWVAFGITFGLTRLITHAIKNQWIPNVNLETDQLHIHHYVLGIALLMLVGYLALVDDKARFHKIIATLYGIGCALIVDEFALLLNLKDVYFAEQGRISVDFAFGILVILGIYVSAYKFWLNAIREVWRFLRRL